MMRPICPVCNQRPRAVAYHRYDKIYYRGRCGPCNRKDRKKKSVIARWQTAGYRKKISCDRCNFRARFASQLLVYHVDGNLNNSALRNLKTVCLNCVEEIKKSTLPWRAGDLEPDL